MILVALADDEALFRKGLTLLLEDYADVQVVLSAADGSDLLHKLQHTQPLPHVLLLDLNMPVLNGIEASKQLAEFFPGIRIIVLSSYYSKSFISNMIELGAAAYLPKNASPETVIRTIREVYEKGYCYTPDVLDVIHENIAQKNRPKAISSFQVELSSREREVLQLICEEYTTPEIAEKLYISPRTVDGHRNNLLEKMGCKNVAGLVVTAIQNQLVHVSPDAFRFR